MVYLCIIKRSGKIQIFERTFMSNMKEKKLKQSIFVIALILLACGYYLNPADPAERQMNGGINHKMQQDGTFHSNFKWEECRNFMYEYNNPDSIFRSIFE